MAVIDRASKTIHCKIAYFGPGMAGKTACLHAIHQNMPADRRSSLRSAVTVMARTILFHCDPPDDPPVGGFKVRFYLVAVPGAILYERTRVAILRGADGVVFIADSQPVRMWENMRSLQELVRRLYSFGQSPLATPVVLQYTKRDLPGAVAVEKMDEYLNPLGWPRFESALGWHKHAYEPSQTVGVLGAFRAVRERVIARLG